MRHISPEYIQDVSAQFQDEGLVPLPSFLDHSEAQALLGQTHNVPTRRVICHNVHISWEEQCFFSGHPAYAFYEQQAVVQLVGDAVGRSSLNQLVVWSSKYQQDEYINPHCDSSGTVQLLTCLQAPSTKKQGGELIVGGRELNLQPGDAVLFRATELTHYTTPIRATAEEPNPRRTVLVGRYFME